MTARREALLAAAIAGSTAAILAWFGPPGADFAAHAYQRSVFLDHGFGLWNNFWYAGRYSFVTYSLLYYPVAALLGIKLLAVSTIAVAALAFALVVWREWGAASRWSSRTFAVAWGGIVLSAAFPFALGIALALLCVWSLQAGRRWRSAALAALTLAASPVAFLLLLVVLGGAALNRRPHLVPAVPIALVVVVELVLWRLFPAGGRYPFSLAEAAAAVAFCVVGLALTWRVDPLLRAVFGVYLVVCVAAYLVPSAVGENVARMRYAAIPLAVLVFSLRHWRPRVLGVAVLALAAAFNVSPLVSSFANGVVDPTAHAAAWNGSIQFLHANLGAAYRVEAVDTATHSPSLYLAEAHIPLARGWFRQDDFPGNSVLYGDLGTRAYLRWLRGLGVEYVVLPRTTPDYSARGEARVVRRLPLVYVDNDVSIYAVPRPQPIARGLIGLSQAQIRLDVRRAGTTRIAVRYSPYWHASAGCLREGADGMLRLTNRAPQQVTIVFAVNGARALEALEGEPHRC